MGTLVSAYLITKEETYASKAVTHLRAWFVEPKTRMRPSLLYGQAIKGKHTGRSIGIIDTLHLVEVARGAKILCVSPSFAVADQKAVKAWFGDYLDWINSHEYGLKEKLHPNNHGVCWSLQASAFADLVGKEEVLAWVRHQFKTVYLSEMMDELGRFPAELKRTKPYGYSLFVIDAMAGVAQIASSETEDLWTFSTENGRSMAKGMAFIYPYVIDKEVGLNPTLYWEEWPSAIPVFCFRASGLETPPISMPGNAWRRILKLMKSFATFRFAILCSGFPRLKLTPIIFAMGRKRLYTCLLRSRFIPERDLSTFSAAVRL